jgi:NhaP-type Na+/H+ or K+/H+ antiporter
MIHLDDIKTFFHVDAANADIDKLKQFSQIPQRLLLIGLPLTILLGFGAGVVLFKGLTLLEIAILATMLAPTDAALGKAVVTNKTVPSNIRESLKVESGLNDGICVPILFLFLAPITQTGVEDGTSLLTDELVGAVSLGILGMALYLNTPYSLLGDQWAIPLLALLIRRLAPTGKKGMSV